MYRGTDEGYGTTGRSTEIGYGATKCGTMLGYGVSTVLMGAVLSSGTVLVLRSGTVLRGVVLSSGMVIPGIRLGDRDRLGPHVITGYDVLHGKIKYKKPYSWCTTCGVFSTESAYGATRPLRGV
eukprot:956606-Rhodomonas_salina.1